MKCRDIGITSSIGGSQNTSINRTTLRRLLTCSSPPWTQREARTGPLVPRLAVSEDASSPARSAIQSSIEPSETILYNKITEYFAVERKRRDHNRRSSEPSLKDSQRLRDNKVTRGSCYWCCRCSCYPRQLTHGDIVMTQKSRADLAC